MAEPTLGLVFQESGLRKTDMMEETINEFIALVLLVLGSIAIYWITNKKEN